VKKFWLTEMMNEFVSYRYSHNLHFNVHPWRDKRFKNRCYDYIKCPLS